MVARMRHLLTVAAAACGLACLAPAALAKPAVCGAGTIQQALIGAGRMTQDDFGNGSGVDLVRCGDVTNDGHADAVFTLASGGTAGDTHFGVLDGSTGKLRLFKPGYKTGVARVNRTAFDVIQPHYGKNDPNCCPSSFRVQRYTWTGSRFSVGHAKKLKTAPRRFYRA
jgi:hypothetical protein